GDEGVAALAKSLASNYSLNSLNINGNYYRSTGMSALINALELNCSLTSLKIGRNYIMDADIKALADTLKKNTSLTDLHCGAIYNNRVARTGTCYYYGEYAAIFGSVLESNQSLISLD